MAAALDGIRAFSGAPHTHGGGRGGGGGAGEEGGRAAGWSERVVEETAAAVYPIPHVRGAAWHAGLSHLGNYGASYYRQEEGGVGWVCLGGWVGGKGGLY